MGKTGKWLKNFLSGKREKGKEKFSSNQVSSVVTENPSTPISVFPGTPREKKRWSFRRSSATAPPPKDLSSSEAVSVAVPVLDKDDEQKRHAMAVAAATAAAAAAAQAAAAVIRLTAVTNDREEEAAATKIQAAYRAYLARQALNALKGIVKLQALVRGHLVRKQADVTLRCMQALVTVQARARAQRIRMAAEEAKPSNPRQSPHRRSTQDQQYRQKYHDIDGGTEENIKIVEMDFAESRPNSRSRNSYSNSIPNYPQKEKSDNQRNSSYSNRPSSRQGYESQASPEPSALTEMSPRAYSGHFEESCFGGTAKSSPQHYSLSSKPDPDQVPFGFPQPDYAESMMSYDYPLYPNYMANTESSRAKARSQSAPKARPDSYERQPSGRRRPSIEGRNVPRAVRMQRSSSQVGAAAQNYQFPWSIKLDRSAVSLIESECGSTSTVLTNTNYCRSMVAYDVHGY